MSAIRVPAVLPLVGLLLTLSGCGGDGGSSDTHSALGTLAYVETECRDTTGGFVERQALRIRQGDRAPVTVFETPTVGPVQMAGLCRFASQNRLGHTTMYREAFQWVAVSPDGTSVVFELTDEFSVLPSLPLNLPPEQKGFFFVHADGSGLRPLGPPSRQRSFLFTSDGKDGNFRGLSFSPSGRTIAFVDRLPTADGQEADQVVTMDVVTGERTPVTSLPPAVPPPLYRSDSPTTGGPVFLDERTIVFYSSANPDGVNPEGAFVLMTITTDTRILDLPVGIPIAVEGGVITPQLIITGDRPQVAVQELPGVPADPLAGNRSIWEIFVFDEDYNVLQLTRFGRSDTWTPLVDPNREHVYFCASADPLGTNPSENCQLFSIDRLGGDLRQLTNFHEREHSLTGCFFNPVGRGCGIYPLGAQDPRSRSLLFYSSCDPLGQNPNGGQLFAIQPDGSDVRQLTQSRGLVREADGTYSSELPGPWAYGPYLP